MLLRLGLALAVASGLCAVPRTSGRAAPLAAACTSSVPATSADTSAVVRAANDFGFDLLARAVQYHGAQNVFLSPVSASIALSLVANGARGQTRRVMVRALHLQAQSPNQISHTTAALIRQLQHREPRAGLDLAQAVWARKSVRFVPTWLQTAQATYGAHIARLDFNSSSAPATINVWVRCATGGTIPAMVDRIPPSVILYVMNAVHFQGHWTVPFRPRNTHARGFTTASGAIRVVPMMNMSGLVAYAQTADYQAAELPYGRGRFGMVVILPRPGASMARLTSGFTASSWQHLTAQLKPAPINLSLPRFTLRDDESLNAPLTALGMGQAFTDHADLSGLCRGTGCRISEVRQRTYLNVDEFGTTAAGATSVSVEPTAIQTAVASMTLDRPFLVAIRDGQTGSVVFAGAVMDPAAHG